MPLSLFWGKKYTVVDREKKKFLGFSHGVSNPSLSLKDVLRGLELVTIHLVLFHSMAKKDTYSVSGK